MFLYWRSGFFVLNFSWIKMGNIFIMSFFSQRDISVLYIVYSFVTLSRNLRSIHNIRCGLMILKLLISISDWLFCLYVCLFSWLHSANMERFFFSLVYCYIANDNTKVRGRTINLLDERYYRQINNYRLTLTLLMDATYVMMIRVGRKNQIKFGTVWKSSVLGL